MRREHFEGLRPVCPRCVLRGAGDPPLRIAAVAREGAAGIEQGALVCADTACQCEYPILDGVPVIVPNVREFVAANIAALAARDDVSPLLDGMLGDCCGPGSAYETARYYLGTYAWDHYAEFDPQEKGEPRPGSIVRAAARGRALLGACAGPCVDVGCAVGRGTFELAGAVDGLVLGVDLNITTLRLAQRVLATGRAAYPRRRVGLVYDRREFPVSVPGADRVDFWACDATALPFAPGTFRTLTAHNVLDCVASPVDMLRSARRVLAEGGRALMSTPYDWSGIATPPEAWLGGHSQRGPEHGGSEAMLRRAVTECVEGFEITAEDADVPWRVRMHDRAAVDYRLHMMALTATAPPR